MRLLEDTLDLVVVADELRRSEFRSLSDDELAELHQRQVVDLIRCRPEIAIVAARTLGWTVTPLTEKMDRNANFEGSIR